jgi:hypothetical protein
VVGPLFHLATLPLRLALRGAETLIRAVTGNGDRPEGEWSPTPTTTPTPTPTPTPVRPREPARRAEEPPSPPRSAPAAEPPPAPAAEEAEPDHVSEEPVLVEEFADPGAEDGAGPEITVAEPWPGYGSMKANEVVARLEEAAPAQVAVARLYEQANRRRKTVLAAADRRLKLLDS